MIPEQSAIHTASIELHVGAGVAYAFLREPLNIGRWALGCMNTRPTEMLGVYAGRSLFDGSESRLSVSAHEESLLIDFLIESPQGMLPRISARVIPGEHYGAGVDSCLLMINAWRTRDMSDERWQRLCACHETEILLIKSLIGEAA